MMEWKYDEKHEIFPKKIQPGTSLSFYSTEDICETLYNNNRDLLKVWVGGGGGVGAYHFWRCNCSMLKTFVLYFQGLVKSFCFISFPLATFSLISSLY